MSTERIAVRDDINEDFSEFNNQTTSSNYQELGRYSEQTISSLMALSDGLIILISGVCLYLLYPGWNPEDYATYFATVAASLFFTLWSFHLLDLYSIDPVNQKKPLIRRVLMVYFIISLVVIALIFALKSADDYSRIWFFGWICLSAFLLTLERLYFYRMIDKWSEKGHFTRNLAIVGAEEKAVRLIESLHRHRDPHIKVVGIFDDRSNRAPTAIHDYPIIGNLESLIQNARQRRIDDVLVTLPGEAEQRTLEILDRLQVLPVRVRVCPDLVGFNFPNHSYSHYAGVPVLDVADKPIDGWDSLVKSMEDQILGILILLLSLPVLLIIAALVKLDSPGSIFFRQMRFGFNNQPIEVLKFRTLYVDSQDESAETLVTRDDPRVTRIGAFLRRSSLDELPQIFNVLKGEMSIVGPRPHAYNAKAAGRYYQNVVVRYAARHKVKPGITGWAQVNGWRGETDTVEKIMKRVEYDLYYIENWSIMFDLRIIFKTFFALLRKENAY